MNRSGSPHTGHSAYSGSFLKRTVCAIMRVFTNCYHYITNADRRAEVFTERKYGDKYFQRSTYTSPDRYPLLFKQCKLLLQDRKEPRLLSYGCSTGEEVISLGNHLPNANIMGVDINPKCIRICNEKNNNPLHVFCNIDDDRFLRSGDFDTIFCMAVFQRAENRLESYEAVTKELTFRIFEAEIEGLHNKLRKGGYLFISHTDFSFQDTRFARLYEPVPFEGNRREINRPLYGTNDRLKANKQFLYRCFIKTEE